MAKAASAKVANDREIQSLDPITHIKLRPSMYVGAVVPSDKEVWVLNEDDTISFKQVTYTEALLKILNEAIDNSFDEFIKTNGEKSNKISIELTNTTFSIEDNGRGIPVVQNSDGSWQCVNAVCRPMSGSNFNDNNRTTIGTNGIGIKAASIFSKYFECVTCDGKGKMKIICKDNLSSEKHTELTPTEKTGTRITFTPDFERLGCKEFSEDVITMVKTRLKFLTWYYPTCNISFNGQKLATKSKDLAKMFPTPSVVLNEKNVYICAYASEEPAILSYVNGISLTRGGTHVDYVMDKIVVDIREKVSKKYKNIKPADIKNRLGLVVFFNQFPNCAFDSQTKETLTNSQADITEYLKTNNIDLSGFTAKILKEKEMLDNITDLFRAKEELAEQKELARKAKVKRDFESAKYFPPVGKSKKKYLMITEGFSAFSGISPILGRQDIGYYMLKGKPLNILDVTASKYMANLEISELVQILGIDISNPDTDMNYEKVVILSDQDSDGTAIAGLIIAMFSKLAPRMLKEGRVCRMETPLLIGMKGDVVEDYYFEFPEKSKMKKTLSYRYMKGLGSWNKKFLNQILEKEGGINGLLRSYEFDKKAQSSITSWFGTDSDDRKKALRGREFHIDQA